jgi:hypothetical protein
MTIDEWNEWSSAKTYPTGTPGQNMPGWGSSLETLWIQTGTEIVCGNHLEATPEDSYQHLMSLWGTGSNDIWVVGFLGRMFHFDGTSWSPVGAVTTKDLYSIWGTASNNIWAVGKKGTILHWNGTSWSVATSPTTQDLYGIMGTDASHIWACGGDSLTGSSTILFFDGTSWSVSAVLAGTQIGRVVALSPTEVYFTSGPYQSLSFRTLAPANQTILFDGTMYQTVTTPSIAGVPATIIYDSALMNGKLYVEAQDAFGSSHLFSLILASGYVNTARFFINENVVAEIDTNVPGGVPLKFMFGARSGATNTKIRMQNGPLQINIGRYLSSPQL